MPVKKKLTFKFHPHDEKEFIKAEAELRKRIESGKRISPKTVKRYLDLLYAKPEKPEKDPMVDEFIEVFRLYIKVNTIFYFKATPYWFDDGKHSLEDWLEKFFAELKLQKIDVRNRKEFLVYTANNLRTYVNNANNPIKHYGICVVTGYIGAMFCHINAKEIYSARRSSYTTYNSYLYKMVNGIWKSN